MASKTTSPPQPDPFSGDWNDSFSGDYLWSNVNFGEAVSQAMTPLAGSVLQFSLADWIFLPGYSTTGFIAGNPYVNISIFATLFRAMGRDQQALLKALEATLYLPLPDRMEIPRISLPKKDLLGGFLASARINLRQQQGLARLPRYLASNQAWCERARGQLAEIETSAELARWWRQEMAPHLLAGVWIVLGTVSQAANTMLALRRKLENLVGPEDASLLIANLKAGDPGAGLVDSLGPVAGIAQVAAGGMRQSDYLARYGHRGPHEFEIAIPRPVEDPAWLVRELARFQAEPVDVAGLMAAQAARFASVWERLATRYPAKSGRLGRQIAHSAQRARQREAARSEYVRDRWMVRLFALKAGALTGLGDAIFYLTLAEVLSLLGGAPVAVDRIPARQAAHQRNLSLPPLPSILRGRFDPYAWAADPERRGDIFDATVETSTLPPPGFDTTPQGSLVLKGMAGSAGRASGRVRVLARPEDGHQLQLGEVLVTTQTDIAWTVLFPRAAAVVTEVGAPLSHAAIVARELGIPAVVGCRNATRLLKTGDRVQVDGGLGEVRRGGD